MVFEFGLIAILALVGLAIGFGLFKFGGPAIGMVSGIAVLAAMSAIVLSAIGFGGLGVLLEMPLLAGLIVFGAGFVVGEALGAAF